MSPVSSRPAGAKQDDIAVSCKSTVARRQNACLLAESMALMVWLLLAGRRPHQWWVRVCEYGGGGILATELLSAERVLRRAVLPHSADPLALPRPADLQALPVAEYPSLDIPGKAMGSWQMMYGPATFDRVACRKER